MSLLCVALLFTQNTGALPDIHDLLREVRAHQERLDVVRDSYTFHQSESIQTLDGSGKILKTTTTESEIIFVNGRRVARLVKREGKPLSEAEERKQTEEVSRRVRKLLKKQPVKRGLGLLTEILAVARISDPRRTNINGRAALAYDFKGDPKAPSHGLAQDALKKTAGVLWFDEAEHQIIRAEIEFFENFHIGGGLLANVQKGSRIDVEQAPIGDGIWMQSATSQHLGVRVIFKGIRENVQTRDFDFRKFDVSVSQQVSRP